MDLGELRGSIFDSIFTAVTYSNLITAKMVGLSWLTWGETIAILAIFVILSKALSIIAEKENEKTEEETN